MKCLSNVYTIILVSFIFFVLTIGCANSDESIKKQLSAASIEQEVFYDGTIPKVKIKIGKINNITQVSNYKVALFVRPDDAYQVWDYQGNSLLSNKNIQISAEIDNNLKIKCFLYQTIIYAGDIQFEKYPVRYEEVKLQQIAINSNVKQSCLPKKPQNSDPSN